MTRDKILKEIADLKISFWKLAEETPKLYSKKRMALSNYQQHIRDKNEIENKIIQLRKDKDS